MVGIVSFISYRLRRRNLIDILRSQSGVASHYIPSHRLQEVEDQLANLETPNSSSENFEKINSTLESFALDPLAAKQEKYSLGGQFRNVVDFVFGKGSIEAIMSALTEIELGKQPNFDHDSLKEWARAAKQKLALRSPTSCKMFIKAFEMAKTQSVGEVLLTDLRLAASCCVSRAIYTNFSRTEPETGSKCYPGFH